MIITIPSYRRAGLVTTDKLVPQAIIVVPKSQENEYKKHHKNVVAISDEEDGSISKKRNAILRMYKGQDIVMLDDDILKFQKTRVVRKEGETRQKELNELEIVSLFENILSRLKKEKKTIGGIYPVQYPIAQRVLKEITYKGFIIGTCMVFEKRNDMLFDEAFSGKEDHDISIRAIYKNKLLRYNHYSFNKQEEQKTGGVSEQRNDGIVRDKELAEKLVKKYSPYVILNKKRPGEVLYKFN